MAHSRWIVEHLNPNGGFFYRAGATLHTGSTAYQEIEVIDSPECGRTLLLDGVTQVTTRNEFLYHEPMVHPALVAHPDPRSVLVIGGGDGGILREVLKHRSVERAVMAELDGGVVDFCARLMPEISKGAFADPRTRIEISDGRAFVERTAADPAGERHDVVLMDMTDPFGPAVMLYTREFFQAVKRTFRTVDGLFVMHTESPIARPRTFQQCQRTLRMVFRHCRVFSLYIPMYGTLWTITVCSDGIDVGQLTVAEIDARLARRGVAGLRCYTGGTHHAMLVPMPFVTDLLERCAEVPAITDAEHTVLDEIDLNSQTRLTISEEA